MSKVNTRPPSGMRDFLPRDVARRRHVVGVIEDVYARYGFVPIETPAIENLSTLVGKYGEEGDRLLYRLLHRGDVLRRALETRPLREEDLADLGLRYDLTVPLARFVAEYAELPRFFKRYQIQPVWRADRPGRGRFREFYQCDVDVLGTTSLIAEAEVVAAVAEVLRRLGFERFVIRLNHRVLLRAMIRESEIEPALEPTALVAVDKLDKVGHAGVREELLSRGIAGSSADRLLALLDGSPARTGEQAAARLRRGLTRPEGVEALAQLEQLVALLETTPASGHVEIRPELARGLDYYTGPIFEITVDDLAGSLGGGGRYDELVGMFSRKPVPAVGCSLGLERILIVMEERGLYPALAAGPQLLLCSVGLAPAALLGVAHRLREQGLRVEVYPEGAKLGKQLQYADAIGVAVAAIAGESELAEDRLTLKYLASGEQILVPIPAVAERLATQRD